MTDKIDLLDSNASVVPAHSRAICDKRSAGTSASPGDFTSTLATGISSAMSLSAACRVSEKAASDLLRQANQARSIIEQAVSAATSALQQLEELKQAEKEAAAEAGEARAVIKQLQGAAAKRRR